MISHYCKNCGKEINKDEYFNFQFYFHIDGMWHYCNQSKLMDTFAELDKVRLRDDKINEVLK